MAITIEDLRSAARAAGITVREVVENIRRTYRNSSETQEEPGIASRDPRADDREAAREELKERAQQGPPPGDESQEQELHEYEPSDYEPDIEKRKAGYGRTGTSSSPQ